MKKRILSLLIVAVMVVGLLPMTAMAAETPVVFTVKAKSDTVAQGGDVEFELTLKTSVALKGFDIYLQIPDGLTLKSGEVPAAATTTLGVGDEQGDLLSFTPGNKLLMLSRLSGTTTPSDEVTILEFTCTAAANTKGDKEVAVAFTDLGYIDAMDGDAAERTTMTSATVNVPKTSYVAPYALTVTYGDLVITDTTAKSVTPTVSGKDAEDDALPATELAKITYAFKGTAPAGLSIDAKTGKVTVTDAAKVVAGNVDITATLTATVKKDVTLTVTKAVSAATTMELAGDTAALIPAEGAEANTYTYTAKVFDQYGAEMTGQSVTWALTDSTPASGATLTGDTLTVPAGAAGGEVTLTATCGSLTKPMKVLVTDIAFDVKEGAIVAEDGVYGDKLADLVKVDGSKITATAGASVSGDFKLVDADTVPNAGEVTYTVTFTSEDGTSFKDIVVKTETITVAPKTITVKADDVKINVKDEVPTEFFATVDGLVNGDKAEDVVTCTVVPVIPEGEKGVDTSKKGEYTLKITAALKNGVTNYELGEVTDGKLTVKKKNTTLPAYGTGTTPEGEQKDPVDQPAEVIFDDVADDAWYHDDVYAAAKAGLMTGVADRTFAPDTTTTRAMIATILWRQAGKPQPRARIADFPDVVDGEWYADAVRWCAEREIVTGYDNGNFGPNDVITREQMVAMLYRYAGSPEVDAEKDMSAFVDVDAVAEYAANAMNWAVANGIITGKDGGRLDPQGLATRAEVSAVVNRFVALEK